MCEAHPKVEIHQSQPLKIHISSVRVPITKECCFASAEGGSREFRGFSHLKPEKSASKRTQNVQNTHGSQLARKQPTENCAFLARIRTKRNLDLRAPKARAEKIENLDITYPQNPPKMHKINFPQAGRLGNFPQTRQKIELGFNTLSSNKSLEKLDSTEGTWERSNHNDTLDPTNTDLDPPPEGHELS